MKEHFARALLASTVLMGASLVATPAFGQELPVPEQPDPEGTTNPADTSSVPTIPQTVAPVEGTPVPSNNAQGEPTRSAQDIIVTGSRIPQPNLESASPVTVVTSQEVKLAGTTRTEDLVNSLPQVFAAQGSNIANAASGTATIQLRGLGSKRSLVLVNGKRLQAGDTGSPVADINFIPSAMIKRVDVLTGGASSVYGADAVAGVVNFIMDTTFTGFRIDGQASVFQHYNDTNDDILAANAARGFSPPHGWTHDGGAQDLAGVFGAAFDDGRGHVTAYATYRTQDPVLQAGRDYSFCALAGLTQTQANTAGRLFNCGGSATSGTGTFLQYDPVTFLNIGVFQVNGTNFVPGTTPFNYAPYNHFQRPDERYTFGAFADYEISSAFKPYAELMFMDDHSDAQIAPSGNFFSTNRVACDNALLSDQQRNLICAPGRTFTDSLNGMADVEQTFTYIGRRNVEGGARDDDLRHSAYRLVGGLRGDIHAGVSYDAYYQFGHTLRDEQYLRDFSITRLGRALDAVAVLDGEIVAPGTAGAEIMCRAAFTGIDPNCVPYDVFRTGGVDQAALDYLQTPGFQRGVINETVAHMDVTVTGDDYGWRLPWAEAGVALNVGAEYRKELLNFQVDEEFRTGDLSGQGGPIPPVKGEFDVREVFGEIQIPIVQKSFIEEFTVTAGYRYSNYHVAGNSFNTDTYKVQAELAPIPDIRFRGSYNRAVRAPNIVELFTPQAIGLSGTVDPCEGPVGPGGVVAGGATLAQCQLTGVTAAQYGNISGNPANQYNALGGGNPDLLPEKADTWTAGVVLQPRFVPGLALTADYFDIKVKDLISPPSFQGVFDACFGGDTASCALVHRAPGSGSLWLGQNAYVILTNQNFSGLGLFTKGFDLQGNYSRRLGRWGTANISLVGTYLTKLGTPFDSRVGTFAQSQPSPKWRHTARAGLTMPNGLGFSVRWRHFSGVECDPSLDVGCGTVANPIPANLRIGAQDYFDLSFTARLPQRINLRLGANNLFDRDPPVLGQEPIPTQFGQSANTYAQVYDVLGRYLFAGFSVDF